MPIPESKGDLEKMGYVFDNEARCRGCEAPIEWWITPRGKKMPMSVKEVRNDGTDNVLSPVVEIRRIPHWSDCPNAGDFRR